jgi:hypothetical protein
VTVSIPAESDSWRAARTYGAVVMVIGIGLFGLLAASLASFMVEKDIGKELYPQMAQIDERLARIETLLGNLQPATAKAQAVRWGLIPRSARNELRAG